MPARVPHQETVQLTIGREFLLFRSTLAVQLASVTVFERQELRVVAGVEAGMQKNAGAPGPMQTSISAACADSLS